MMLIIIGISVADLFFRWLAFDKTESCAVEITFVSFAVNFAYSVISCAGAGDFLEKYLMRNVILFALFALSCAAHRFYFEQCMKGVIKRVEAAKTVIKESSEMSRQVDVVDMLDDMELVSRRCISVCYSRFIDRLCQDTPVLRGFMNLINHNGSSKGFKHNKTVLRQKLASVVSHLIKEALGDNEYVAYKNRLREDDFNISENMQMIGLFTFQVLPVLAIIIGSRII